MPTSTTSSDGRSSPLASEKTSGIQGNIQVTPEWQDLSTGN